MITLTSAVSASAAAQAGLHQAMEGAGQSSAALSSGEVRSASAAPSAGVAPEASESNAPNDSSVGRMLNERA